MLHNAPFIRIYTLLGKKQNKTRWNFTLKRLYINIFSHKKLNFCRLFKVFEPFESAYPNTFIEILCNRYRDASPVVGGRTVQDFSISYLTTKEPFYLTVDKTARLALIEPPKKKENPTFFSGAIRVWGFQFPTRFQVAVISYFISLRRKGKIYFFNTQIAPQKY